MTQRLRTTALLLGTALVCFSGHSGMSYAQNDGAQQSELSAAPEASKSEGQVSGLPSDSQQENMQSSNEKDGINIEAMPSLFFTYWQHQAISDAKNSRGVVRPPTAAELAALEEGEDFKPDPGIRELSLGGIVFTRDGEWTIWLNGQRVTPSAVPKEVLDLEVYKDYIEIKWLDDYTNRVYPVRLRAHQRFNLDMRIFLPG